LKGYQGPKPTPQLPPANNNRFGFSGKGAPTRSTLLEEFRGNKNKKFDLKVRIPSVLAFANVIVISALTFGFAFAFKCGRSDET